jgi:hypothetical protein
MSTLENHSRNKENPQKEKIQHKFVPKQHLKTKIKSIQTTLSQFMQHRTVAPHQPVLEPKDYDTHQRKTTENKQLSQSRLHQFAQIEITNYDNGNYTFGNELWSVDDSDIFYFHNINGIESDDNWAQILLTLMEHNVTCFGIAETNTSFAHPQAKEYIKKIQQSFKHSRYSTSERVSNKVERYKPGGTMTVITGKWQA